MRKPDVAAMIARGMRHVALPKGRPVKIGVVIEYPGSVVRHEFAPGAETCICCGEVIPEGRQVCARCERGGGM